MPAERPEDLDLLLGPDFGVEALISAGGGPSVRLRGIFTAPHEAAAGGAWPGVSTSLPSLTVAAFRLPPAARAGDALTIGGESFTLRDLRPDGSGLVRLILER